MSSFAMPEFQERLRSFQSLLGQKGIDLAILNQNPDLYYYTGSVQPLYLMVPKGGEPFLVARKALTRIAAEVPWLALEVFNNTADLKGILKKHEVISARRIGFATDKTVYSTVLRWQQLLNNPEIVDLSWELHWQRMFKSSAEIAVLTEGGRIMAEIPRLVKDAFRPGMTELELSVVIESYLRQHGHGGLVRCRREAIEMNYGVCAGGVNALAGTKFEGICSGVGLSPAVPFGAADQRIKPNEPVILDYGFNYQGYHIDQTRMLCWGQPLPEVEQAYRAMLEIELELIKNLQSGVSWNSCYELALKMAREAGLETEFMGVGTEQVRFVGHGVGLELDEPPFLAPKMEYSLASGMAVALEPKVAIPAIGVIGPEDTVLIGEEPGATRLTTASQEIIIID